VTFPRSSHSISYTFLHACSRACFEIFLKVRLLPIGSIGGIVLSGNVSRVFLLFRVVSTCAISFSISPLVNILDFLAAGRCCSCFVLDDDVVIGLFTDDDDDIFSEGV